MSAVGDTPPFHIHLTKTMSKHLIRQLNTFSAVIVVTAILSIYSCTEDIDYSNRYTFIGETAASYLQEHEETFGHFLYILEKGGKLNLLKAYGTYTVFAPTNEAIERYLIEQDSIYKASLLPGAKRVIWTGVTSSRLEDLSDSMCVYIAKTHIFTQKILTTAMEGDILPGMNLNDRYLSVSFGQDKNKHSLLFVNDAQVITGDEEVENGVVHVMASVLNPSTDVVPTLIENMPFLTIFSEGLKKTGLVDKMQDYKDESYTLGDRTTLSCHDVPGCPYPKSRYHGYTAFCEPDEVFNAQGIYSIDDLARKCQEWYPEATDPDFHSPNNALWKFMSYHLLDRKLPYTRLVCYNVVLNRNGDAIFKSEENYMQNADRVEYYETFQGSIMKLCCPCSNDLYGKTILINYSNDLSNFSDPFDCPWGTRGARANVQILDPSITADKTRFPHYKADALNGSIHLLGNVLVYDEELMKSYVLNGPIRMDFSSMIPEFSNNNVRWSTGDNIDFMSTDYEFYIPAGYSESLVMHTAETRLYYLSPHTSWSNFQGDEFMGIGQYDFSIRLPHLPSGTYEIRTGYNAHPNRGFVQLYIDNQVTGLPVDMRILLDDPRIGYIPDAETTDNGVANDKQMKNRGFLKGPTTFRCQGTLIARNDTRSARMVLVTKYLTEGDHWLRYKNLEEISNGSTNALHLDYLELVPVGWLRRDDLSLEEKRK